MLSIKTFQIIVKGIDVQNDQNGTRIQVQLSGKDPLIFGIVFLIAVIGLLFLILASMSKLDLTSPGVIAFIALLILPCVYAIIDGILVFHTKYIIDIDDNKALTVSMERPIGSKPPVTFYYH